MGERSLLERAKGGEADAIAVLLNRSLQRRGITVRVQRQAGDLHLLLEAMQVPDRNSAVTFVQQEFTRLNVNSLSQVNVFGRRRGDPRSTWRECFQLRSIPSGSGQLSPNRAVNQTVEQRSQRANRPLRSPPISKEAAIAAGKLMLTIPGQFASQRALGISQSGWGSLAIGWVLAMLILSSGRLTFIFHPLITLVHELGHAVFGWLLGYPAIPAFDFIHGGGVTSHFGRLRLLIGAIYIGFGYVYYQYRNNYLTLRYLLGGIIIYSLLILTPIHESIITMMGHGFELLFAGIFLYRALSDESCHYPVERPIYGMLAFFTLAYDTRFAYRLIFDWQTRIAYLQGKGGILHDLTRLANQYSGGNVSTSAAVLLGCCLLTPLITLFLYRHRGQVHCLVDRLFRVSDDSQFRKLQLRKAPSRYSGG